MVVTGVVHSTVVSETSVLVLMTRGDSLDALMLSSLSHWRRRSQQNQTIRTSWQTGLLDVAAYGIG